MNCYHCHAETTNGLALCEGCRAAASVYLEYLPAYFRNLARWQPGRAGSRPVPSSREPVSLTPARTDRVQIALEEAGNALTTWARMLSDDRGLVPPTADDEVEQVEALCRWFAENITSIATLEWCGEFIRHKRDDEEVCDSIAHQEYRLRRLTENVVPGWYAGACRRCATSTYVIPGLTWVTCGGCGTTTFARDHVDTIIEEARSWVAPPMRLAETIVALIDTELSVPRLHKRISKWGERGQVESLRRIDVDGDPVGPKRYRLGSVLDTLRAEGATRLDVILDAAAS